VDPTLFIKKAKQYLSTEWEPCFIIRGLQFIELKKALPELKERIIQEFIGTVAGDLAQTRPQIQKRADTWTEKREQTMTSLVQSFNDAETITRAKNIWWSTIKSPMFRYVSPKVIETQEKLCRALCAEEVDIKNVAFRCWKQLGITPKTSEARVIIEEHLTHYGEIGM
jgi:hypothetical protein